MCYCTLFLQVSKSVSLLVLYRLGNAMGLRRDPPPWGCLGTLLPASQNGFPCGVIPSPGILCCSISAMEVFLGLLFILELPAMVVPPKWGLGWGLFVSPLFARQNGGWCSLSWVPLAGLFVGWRFSILYRILDLGLAMASLFVVLLHTPWAICYILYHGLLY
jgi:hypothetical protein